MRKKEYKNRVPHTHSSSTSSMSYQMKKRLLQFLPYMNWSKLMETEEIAIHIRNRNHIKSIRGTVKNH